MRSPSKKHAKITLAKYNAIKKENDKNNSSTSSKASGVLQVTSTSNQLPASAPPISSTTYYHIKRPNEGIDMSIIRCNTLRSYIVSPTILTNISKSTTTKWSMHPLQKSNDETTVSLSWCNIPIELVNKQ